jgi:hypothetical protein
MIILFLMIGFEVLALNYLRCEYCVYLFISILMNDIILNLALCYLLQGLGFFLFLLRYLIICKIKQNMDVIILHQY